jgi:hypothetical protein
MKLKYLSVIISIILVSCNPVKKVMQDPVKFDVVAKEVIRRGYCKADTVIEYKDSIVFKDSIIERIYNVPCEDLDTTIGRARITVRSGVLTYRYSDSIIKQTIIKKIRDLSVEQVLRSDVASRDSIINVREKEILSLQIANSEQKEETRKWRWKFIGLIAAVVLFIVVRVGLKTYLNRL